jgi:hypothetical protein
MAVMLGVLPLAITIWVLSWNAWNFATKRRRQWRSSRRVSRLVCAGCGYDLRGSGESCPECGRWLPESYETIAARFDRMMRTDVAAGNASGDDTGAGRGWNGGTHASHG